MKYFDSHCDTLYEMYKRDLSFCDSALQVNSKAFSSFESYGQIFAVWSQHEKSEKESWEQFFKIKEVYEKQILPNKSDAFTPVLAVEGGKLLEGKLERIKILYNHGVRIITLVWKDDCCIGGAYNTENGLTEFGREAVCEMLKAGIVPDISHSSDKTAFETLEIAGKYGKPVIASHSNSRSVFYHKRNLTDDLFEGVKKTGGIAGISMAPQHLAERADISAVCAHIAHYLSLGGEDNVCLGCDFDGVESLPDGISGVLEISKIFDALTKSGISGRAIEKIFYINMEKFIRENMAE